MSRHSLSRIDRVAQMSMQEEIIARKKLEILEKQKTAELAKQVVAAQTASSKPSKKDKAAVGSNSTRTGGGTTTAANAASMGAASGEAALGLPKNSFNNDGSFFENFKKITEAAKKAQQEQEAKLNAPALPIITTLSQARQEQGHLPIGEPIHILETAAVDTFIADFHPAAAVLCAKPPPPPPPPPPSDQSLPIATDVDPTTGSPFYDECVAADNDAGFLDFEQSREPPVVTKPLTQYTGLVPTHSDGREIPGFGMDAAEQAVEEEAPVELLTDTDTEQPHQPQQQTPPTDNRAPFFDSMPQQQQRDTDSGAASADQFNNAAASAGAAPTQPQQLPFMQSGVVEESTHTQSSPAGSYVNPFAQQVRPMQFHPMDQHHMQHMQFAQHMNPFTGRPPPMMHMQHHPQHFGGPPPFMPAAAAAAAAAFQHQQQQQHQHQQFQQHLQQQQQQHHQQQLQQQFHQQQQQQHQMQQQHQQQLQHQQQQQQQQPHPHSMPPPPHVAMQLNAIPAPISMDLAAIPEPTLNLEAINVPDLQQQQQLQQDISRDHEFIPTSVESLVELVAENGDEYEDRLRSRKIDMHPSMWFLCDTASNAYRNYRQKVMALRYNTDDGATVGENSNSALDDAQDNATSGPVSTDIGAAAATASDSVGQVQQTGNATNQPPMAATDDKYDPADMYDDDDDEDGGGGGGSGQDDNTGGGHNDVDERAAHRGPPSSDDHRHDRGDRDDRGRYEFALQPPPPATQALDYDSDSEYMREAKSRNFGQQLKRKHDIDERQQQQQMMFVAAGGNGGEAGGQADDDTSDEDGAVGVGIGGASSMSVDDLTEAQRKKRSRWGDKISAPSGAALRTGNPFAAAAGSSSSAAAASSLSGGGSAGGQTPAMLTHCTRTNPALLAYARQSYGTTELDDETWRKCEDHFKVNLLYQDMLRKRNEMDRLARSGRKKYEYDSDEDVAGGTWEHKVRNAEMEATAVWSDALTKQAEGKHHIGDFLPPEELRKFMEKYESQQTNREPDLSDYREYKLREDNKGFQMLKKYGWQEGQGLGFDGTGIVDPVNKAQQRDSNQGLGTMNAATPDFGDSEYDMYRKRMMLAYRFRPNPLNNPRRSYY